MVKIFSGLTILTTLVILSGCAGHKELVETISSGSRQDVFQEITPDVAPASGYADLRIYTSMKTHKPGIYSAKDIHGTADYKIILNIDSQAAELHSELREEKGEAGAFLYPETGEGIRYNFSKNIRIKSGTHKIVIAIPADGLAVTSDITLAEGSSNSLALEPVYGVLPGKQRTGLYGVTSFREGLKGIRLIFNGKSL